MSKRRPLTPCTKGKTQKVIAKEAGCSQSSLSKHINRAKGRKRCGRKKCTSNRDNRTLERIVKQNHSKMWGIHKEWTAAGVSASRTTTHRRMHDMGFSCRIPCVKPLLNNRQRQKRLAWAKDKRTGLLLSGPKLCSLMKVNLAFPLEIRVPESGGERRDTESTLLEVQCKVSTVSDGLGCHVICWCWSTVFSEVQGQHPYTRRF